MCLLPGTISLSQTNSNHSTRIIWILQPISPWQRVAIAGMSRTTATNTPPKGFSILQPTLGAPLSWMPAVGTKELDQLLNAYLPGPGSAQEKRAAVSIDFFEHANRTGESFKYYAVTTAAVSSPASSASASPAISDLTYSGSSPSQASTPASNMARTTSRRPSAKPETTNSSHLPGMKILTMDGQDVTTSVSSRGCKTKEQREHAHLMRVLKACDACKKKKIRCDPSHKRRATSQAKAETTTKPAAKKARKAPPTPASQAAAFTPAPEASFEIDLNAFDALPSVDESWDEFLSWNDAAINEPIPQDFYSAVPQGFDFFFGQDSQFSPAVSGSSGSFDSPAQPLTPVNSNVLAQTDFAAFNDDSTLAFLQASGQEPVLPYLDPSIAHGSNYVDFNLYSPASSFIDEEPQKLKAGHKRKASALQTESAAGSNATSPGSLHESLSSTGLVHAQQWGFDPSVSATSSPQSPESRVPGTQDEVVGGGIGGGQRPYHANDTGHNSARAVVATRQQALQPQRAGVAGNSPVIAPTVSLEGRERNTLLPHGLGLGIAASTTVSAPVSPRVLGPQTVVQQGIIPVGGNAQEQSRTVSLTVSCPPSPLSWDSRKLTLAPKKDLHIMDSSRSTSRQSHSRPTAALPVSTAVVASSPAGQGEASHQQGGLSPAGGVALPVGRLQRPVPVEVATSGSTPAARIVSASRDTTQTPVCGSGFNHGPVICLSDTTAAAPSASSSTGGLVPSSRLPSQGHGLGQEGQVLHDVTAPATAASSSPQRLAVNPTQSPVRQLPGRLAATTMVVAMPTSSLVVSGLLSVSILMLLLMTVAFTTSSLLQLQLQTQAHTISAIIAHVLPPSSLHSPSILCIFSSLLYALSASTSHNRALPIWKGNAVDSARSVPGRRCRDRSAWTGFARVPMACF